MIIAAFAIVFSGCGPAKTKAPDPNPVGQWQWHDGGLHTARFEFTSDGNFVRETTGPIEPKSTKVTGTWRIANVDPEPSWMERHGILQKHSELDELERTRTGKYPVESTVWSAHGTLTLRYSVPKGIELVPGSTVVASKPKPLSVVDGKPEEISVEENQAVRTRTDTATGEVSLDLDGKIFGKVDSHTATAASARAGSAATGTKEKSGSKSAALIAEGASYLTLEPFAGVTLDLPSDWHSLDPEAAEPAPPSTPVTELVGKRGFAKAETSWGFVPPGHVGAEMNIALNAQPANLPPPKMMELPQEAVDRLAKSFGDTLAPILDAKGYRLKGNAKSERVKSGERPAILWEDEALSASGSVLAAQILFVPLEKRTLVGTFLWVRTPNNTWEPTMERARSSLRVTDSVIPP